MKKKDFQILTFPKVQRDNSLNKKAELKYRKQLKIIAHDLNNILTGIASGVELARNNLDDKLIVNNLLKHIENNTHKAHQIVNEILIKKDSLPKPKRKINLETVIDETIISVKDSLSKNVTIEFNSFAINDSVFSTHTDIYRVLLNLIMNANDAIKGKGKISVELSNWNDDVKKPINKGYNEYAVIKITDNGKGIEKKNIAKIFDEGFSTKNSDKEKGLGLSIVKNIIENLDGFIKVNSKPDEGTTFEVFIPTLSYDSDKISFKNQTVIIAEDDSFQREVLKDLLSSMNLKVLSAINGIDVLNFYNKEKIDLIIVDKNMPEMNGIECINEIRRIDTKTPIILSTGNTEDDEEEKAVRNKISNVLRKPYSFATIQNLVLDLLTV